MVDEEFWNAGMLNIEVLETLQLHPLAVDDVPALLSND
jgi:hypothetical protein